MSNNTTFMDPKKELIPDETEVFVMLMPLVLITFALTFCYAVHKISMFIRSVERRRYPRARRPLRRCMEQVAPAESRVDMDRIYTYLSKPATLKNFTGATTLMSTLPSESAFNIFPAADNTSTTTAADSGSIFNAAPIADSTDAVADDYFVVVADPGSIAATDAGTTSGVTDSDLTLAFDVDDYLTGQHQLPAPYIQGLQKML